MKTTNRNYESLYIVDATLTDEQVDAIAAKYSSVITNEGGEVQAAGRWDKRRLAYEVKERREGTYILMYFTGEAPVAKELDRVQRIADDVLRHIIVRVEPEHIDMSRIGQQQASVEAPASEGPAAQEPVAALDEALQAEIVEAVQESPAEPEQAEEAPAVEESPAEAPTEEPAAEG